MRLVAVAGLLALTAGAMSASLAPGVPASAASAVTAAHRDDAGFARTPGTASVISITSPGAQKSRLSVPNRAGPGSWPRVTSCDLSVPPVTAIWNMQ
jgi:hypothetical protein